jgi:two-component system, LytTR family, response regulator
MIKAIHIEDEPRNIELLQLLVQKHCAQSVVLAGSAQNMTDAIALIKQQRPQLIYLDIELSKGNAFELLEQLAPVDFEVIFVTAFNEYAVRAFRHHAVDYLLKPISSSEFKEATARAVERIEKKDTGIHVMEAISMLRQGIAPSKIGIPVSDGLLFVHAKEIVRAEASGSYTLVYLLGGKTQMVVKSLKDMEDILPASSFIRVHHSWVINSSYIKKYFRGKHSYMEMEDGSTVPVSIRKKGDFLSSLH